MKKVMVVALAVLFSAGLFAQTPQKPAEKKEPAKTEQKATSQPAKHPEKKHQTTTSAQPSNSKPAEHKTEAKPMKK